MLLLEVIYTLVAKRFTLGNIVLIAGYDKLKPYGIPIHGAIDGYSQKIPWLHAVKSNNLSAVPAQLFLDCIREVDGIPVLLRTDAGTENNLMASAQCYFRRHATDPFSGNNAHRPGPSPSNQRIESWWSIMRKGSSSWWINFFQDMCISELFDPNNKLHKEFAWFCFSRVIQKSLDQFKKYWNTHYIWKCKHGSVAGIPDALFFVPEETGTIDYKCQLPTEQDFQEVEGTIDNGTVDTQESMYAEYVIQMMGLEQPSTVESGFILFQQLVNSML